jgi:hypothetical protein
MANMGSFAKGGVCQHGAMTRSVEGGAGKWGEHGDLTLSASEFSTF